MKYLQGLANQLELLTKLLLGLCTLGRHQKKYKCCLCLQVLIYYLGTCSAHTHTHTHKTAIPDYKSSVSIFGTNTERTVRRRALQSSFMKRLPGLCIMYICLLLPTHLSSVCSPTTTLHITTQSYQTSFHPSNVPWLCFVSKALHMLFCSAQNIASPIFSAVSYLQCKSSCRFLLYSFRNHCRQHFLQEASPGRV